MTPSNPDNNQPLIYRIADALGITHLVVAVQHSHLMSEITGLAAALAAKQDALNFDTTPTEGSTNPVTSGGIKTALNGKANAVAAGSPSGGIVIAGTSGELARSNKTVQDLLNAIAAKQDALNFDTTPTAGSTNPVTSGGIKTALNGKANVKHGHDSIGGTSTAQDASVSCERDTVRITAENEVIISIEGQTIHLTVDNYENLVRALTDPDSTPTANSNNLVTSGGVKAAIDALTTSVVPIHQVAAILPKTSGDSTDYEAQSWLGDGKMALVLQTARPITVCIEAFGYDDSPDGTWSGSADIYFDLAQGIRTVKNIYDLMSARLQHDYPGEYVGVIKDWKIFVEAKNTVPADTACLINFYNPTSAE